MSTSAPDDLLHVCSMVPITSGLHMVGTSAAINILSAHSAGMGAVSGLISLGSGTSLADESGAIITGSGAATCGARGS